MSKSLNLVEFIGYLGRDPEVLTFQNRQIVRFPLATHDVWRDPDSNELQTHTDWHRIIVMGKQAQTVQAHLKKGALIYVRGKLRTRRYHDDRDRPRFITEILGLHFLFLDPPTGASTEVPDDAWVEDDDQSLVELTDYLWEKAGPLVRSGLSNKGIFEIVLNPDGRVWFANHCSGYECVGCNGLGNMFCQSYKRVCF